MNRRLRTHVRGMSRRLAALIALALAAGAAWAPAASAQGAPGATARLEGSFQLTGRITAAVNVAGERRGQTFSRIWSFSPQCEAGPCTSVVLTRPRAGGSDTVLLTEQSSGYYTGAGQFYAPLRCRGRINLRGELVPFQVSVTITDTTVTSDGVVAQAVSTTYTNLSRTNLTRCVQPPSHDAATYQGQLIQSG